jgi:hypothetical protein
MAMVRKRTGAREPITGSVDIFRAHVWHRPLPDRPRRPAMVQILRELVAGVPQEHLRRRAAQVLDLIDTGRARELGDDE